MKKITAIVHDLSSNPIVRSHSILQSLISIGFDIEVVGFLIERKDIFKPYSNYYNYKHIYVGPKPSIIKIIYYSYKLFKKCEGDYIYIFKPLPTTCITAFFYSFFCKKKIICCDVEDNEININYKNFYLFLKSFWSIKYNYIFFLYFKFKKTVSVANKELQKQYKGKIIYHGPIINNKSMITSKTDASGKINILFAGTPRNFKGINMLISLIQEKELKNYTLITVGSDYNNFYSKHNTIENYKYLGLINNDKISSIMNKIDIVIIPSQINSYTKYQTPAKLLEAMAFSKIIITNNLPAMRELLGDDKGIILEDFSMKNLKTKLIEINKNRQHYNKMAHRAYVHFKKYASKEANAKILSRMLCDIKK